MLVPPLVDAASPLTLLVVKPNAPFHLGSQAPVGQEEIPEDNCDVIVVDLLRAQLLLNLLSAVNRVL